MVAGSDMPGLEDLPLRILHTQVIRRLGRIRHVLFDFDGTLSVLREGWESIMIPMMLKNICGEKPVTSEIEQEVRDYVDRSTGILTIQQMRWLEAAVHRYQRVPSTKTAAEYKAEYVLEILQRVRERQKRVQSRQLTPDEMMICGAREFLNGLVQRDVTLYLSSGTDHEYVLDESGCLGLDLFFKDKIFGALDASESHDKERVIRRILNENGLYGDELLVIGDGPVEIRVAADCEAVTLGVASDEIARSGWNERKVRRLREAGADLLIPDFLNSNRLLHFLFPPLD